jgi:cyclopropane fatty-acyl-phospholipid synthase-like methyltransferase
MSDKPFCQPCENNKSAILEQLIIYFQHSNKVIEIGSGTGQHAVHFAAELPHLIWQCTDQLQYHHGINQWIAEYPLKNLRHPLEFTIGKHGWIDTSADAVFSANTAHIMQADEVKLMMEMIGQHLPEGGVFCQYGPFTQNGQFSSEGNMAFHSKLVAEGYGGYRDISELTEWGSELQLHKIVAMPANNLLLVWHKN